MVMVQKREIAMSYRRLDSYDSDNDVARLGHEKNTRQRKKRNKYIESKKYD